MLQSVYIKDNQNTPYSYIPKLFKNDTLFNFNPGVNILIGPNGSGKSTILNIISLYLWCGDKLESQLHWDNFRLFSDDNELKDGVIVKHDFCTKVFQYKHYKDFKSEQEGLINFSNFKTMFKGKRSSAGENTLIALDQLFDTMFDPNRTKDECSFVINEIIDIIEKSEVNDYYLKRYKALYKYYKENRVVPEKLQFTVLMDEPDRNLDITKIDEIYGILSSERDDTQLIVSIHNPILIYKLSKLSYINFIELEKGYLNKVKKVMKTL